MAETRVLTHFDGQANTEKKFSPLTHVDSVFYDNGTFLGDHLNEIDARLLEGYTFISRATFDTDPGVPKGKVYYIASEKGTYGNFGLTVPEDGTWALMHDFTEGAKWRLERLNLKMTTDMVHDNTTDSKLSDVLITSDYVGGVNMPLVTDGSYYMGIARPASTPTLPSNSVFYFAKELGIYENYGKRNITENGLYVFKHDTDWTMEPLFKIKNGPGQDTTSTMSQKAITDLISNSGTGKKTTEGGEIYNDIINNKAMGENSHAEGTGTIVRNNSEHAEGKYNHSTVGKTISTVGIGSSDSDRKNAVEITNEGNMYVYGIGGYDGTNQNVSKSLSEILLEYYPLTLNEIVNGVITVKNTLPNPSDKKIGYVYSVNLKKILLKMTNVSNMDTIYYSVATNDKDVGNPPKQGKIYLMGNRTFIGVANGLHELANTMINAI